MASLNWLQGNWFTLLQSAGIIGSLLFTAASLRLDAKVRRVGNLLRMTEGHRNIWSELYARPELGRILNPTADLKNQPVTKLEELFVTFLILHLSGSFRAIREGLFIPTKGLRLDITLFFALPIPRSVWETSKPFYNDDFVRFIEEVTATDGR